MKREKEREMGKIYSTLKTKIQKELSLAVLIGLLSRSNNNAWRLVYVKMSACAYIGSR